MRTLYENPEGIYEPLISKEEKSKSVKKKVLSKKPGSILYINVETINEEEDEDDPPCKHTHSTKNANSNPKSNDNQFNF